MKNKRCIYLLSFVWLLIGAYYIYLRTYYPVFLFEDNSLKKHSDSAFVIKVSELDSDSVIRSLILDGIDEVRANGHIIYKTTTNPETGSICWKNENLNASLLMPYKIDSGEVTFRVLWFPNFWVDRYFLPGDSLVE